MKCFNRSAFISDFNIYNSISAVRRMNELLTLQHLTVEGNWLIHWYQAFTHKNFCSLSEFMLSIIIFIKFLFIFKNFIAIFPVDKTNNCLFRFGCCIRFAKSMTKFDVIFSIFTFILDTIEIESSMELGIPLITMLFLLSY